MNTLSKYLIVCTAAVMFFCTTAHAQREKQKIKVYKAWVKTLEGERMKGFLFTADSSSVYLIKLPDASKGDVSEIPINTIDEIKIRRRSKVLKGSGIGLLSGAVVGFLIGYAGGDDPPCMSDELFGCLFYVQSTAGEKGAAGAFILAIPGAIVGAVIGTGREKFPIKGNEATYFRHLSLLRSYSLVQER